MASAVSEMAMCSHSDTSTSGQLRSSQFMLVGETIFIAAVVLGAVIAFRLGL